jgi:RNA polymerase sigma-70 factor, ECF subfamily
MQTDSSTPAVQSRLTRQDLVDLYQSLSPQLFRYAVRLLGDADLAEECVAETFSRLLAALQRGLGPRDNPRAYLYQTAHNWIMDTYRRGQPEERIDNLQLSASFENLAGKTSLDHEGERVRQALLELPDDQRQVIMLRFYEDWSHAATAAAIGRSVEATRALQYRALNELRRLLVTVEE